MQWLRFKNHHIPFLVSYYCHLVKLGSVGIEGEYNSVVSCRGVAWNLELSYMKYMWFYMNWWLLMSGKFTLLICQKGFILPSGFLCQTLKWGPWGLRSWNSKLIMGETVPYTLPLFGLPSSSRCFFLKSFHSFLCMWLASWRITRSMW